MARLLMKLAGRFHCRADPPMPRLRQWPQAIFLKAAPRAGRPEMPTVPQPHRTASKEGRNTVGVFDAHLNSAAQRSKQPLGRAGTARDFARSD